MQGVSDATLDLIAPFTTVYPKENTNKDRTSPINFNTADAPVIASAHPIFAGGLAQAIVSKRRTIGRFKDKTDLIRVQFAVIGSAIDTAAASPQATPQDKDLESLIDVRTNYFLATGRIQLSRVDIARQTLIWRNDRQLEVVWVRDI
jgi:type II secretory pathway component PulK